MAATALPCTLLRAARELPDEPMKSLARLLTVFKHAVFKQAVFKHSRL
jgi:hypothetical protein